MRNKGFTLIELIVIIAVLAILVTIGVPRYLGHTKEANFTKLKHDARIIQDASDRYYIDHNDWPYLLDEDGNKLIVSNPKELTIIYKVEDYDESNLGTNPDEDIVLYEIDFDKLKPYIRKLHSDTAYFVAARANLEFGITVLDPKSNKDRITPPINEGTPEGPGEVGKGEIIIRTAEDLAKIGKDENYPLNGNYIQMADIDLSGYRDGEGWVPIGNYTNRFTGKFDGNGFKIRNLYIDRPNIKDQGLFGYTKGATLTNISLENVNVTGEEATGGLVGGADESTISNSYATGSVEGGYYTGGLVGDAINSTISNSYATGSVSGENYTGGLIGSSEESTITNSYATGSVSGRFYTGGLVGYAKSSSTITNSYATGSVTGIFYIGGLVGYVDESTISNSYWDEETTDQNISAGGGTGLSTSQMKEKSTYVNAGWDFVNTWDIIEGESYPFLKSNPQNPPPGTN